MSRPPCTIDGCDKASRGRGWCATHWSRWRKHGDPLHVMLPGRDYNLKNVSTCTVEDCESTQLAKGLCVKHYGRVRKHGDPHRVDPGGRPVEGEHPGWAAIHKRLDRERGKATGYTCADCGGRAREWSYDNADPNELRGRVGRWMLRYSLEPAHYAPRCTPCHRRFDRKAAAA